MSLLIETIKLLDGRFYNLPRHQERMVRSLADVCKARPSFDLNALIYQHDFPRQGCYKCRVLYDAVSAKVAFAPYEKKSIRRIKVVEDNDISYPYKFSDRTQINRLYDQRGPCDDVLIVRDNRVTDCSYANVLFSRGGRWYTPDSPLLKGTMRAKLLDENKIQAREILKGDIRSFDSFKIINAMLEFDGPEIDVSDIVF